ncbi:MAG: exo-alpha-sialidase [Methanobacteriota archaeon]
MMFASSRDWGRTWTPARPVDDRPGRVFLQAFPLVRADGVWHVAYFEESPEEEAVALLLATSRDRGSSWEVREVAGTAYQPSIKEGLHQGNQRIWFTYAAVGGGPGRAAAPSIMWSDDGGDSWSPPLPLDAPRPFPLVALDVAKDGTAYVAWFREVGPESELRVVAIRDGTMSDPLLLATVPGKANDIGDYFGLAAHPGGVLAMFTARLGETHYDVHVARAVIR